MINIRYVTSEDKIKFRTVKAAKKDVEKSSGRDTIGTPEEVAEKPRLFVGEYCFSDDIYLIYDNFQLVLGDKVLYEHESNRGFQLLPRAFLDLGIAVKEVMKKHNLSEYSLENGKRYKIINGHPVIRSIGILSPLKQRILEDILTFEKTNPVKNK